MINSKITFCERIKSQDDRSIWAYIAIEDLQNLSTEKQAEITNLVAQLEKDIKQIVNPESND
jgi:hypothetical protein